LRPFEGINIVDVTHVLAGPFASYQLAVLGASVIKVECPDDCDQSRHTGPDAELNRRDMGANYLAQGSNKRAITLNLKTEKGREILRQLAAKADVFVENYRSGAFRALGLGYDDLKKLNPRLIYCSMTAFGQHGPRGTHTAYDHAIQASSGIMAATGTPEVSPLKTGAPVIDYSTGTTAAFAIATALFQRERSGRGQHIDCSMLDVALMLQASHITGHSITGKEGGLKGNQHTYATGNMYETKQGHVMLAASNNRQSTRLYKAVGRPELGGTSYETRRKNYRQETAELTKIMKEKTAQEWEDYFQAHHVPAMRVRTMHEALEDPQLATRNILHRHASVPGVDGAVTVPLCAFKFEHGGPSIETPPPRVGEHTDEVLQGLGYGAGEIAALRAEHVV
jgi:crotonobetainyl-CoA:carnitine CoA-transferase CaiB-like acyl-CoA transferase